MSRVRATFEAEIGDGSRRGGDVQSRKEKYKHYLKKCWPEKKKVKTMLPEAISKSKRVSHSLTDRILILCISERFGVREAIAEAIRHKRETNKTPAQRHGFREKTR